MLAAKPAQARPQEQRSEQAHPLHPSHSQLPHALSSSRNMAAMTDTPHQSTQKQDLTSGPAHDAANLIVFNRSRPGSLLYYTRVWKQTSTGEEGGIFRYGQLNRVAPNKNNSPVMTKRPKSQICRQQRRQLDLSHELRVASENTRELI